MMNTFVTAFRVYKGSHESYFFYLFLLKKNPPPAITSWVVTSYFVVCSLFLIIKIDLGQGLKGKW